MLTRRARRGAIVSPGETIFSLTLNSPVWVRTYVNERDLGRIEPGMKAEVRTDSAPDKIYIGTDRLHFSRRRIHPQDRRNARTADRPGLSPARLVDNPDGGLRQGMPVTVTLDVGHKD